MCTSPVRPVLKSTSAKESTRGPHFIAAWAASYCAGDDRVYNLGF